MVYSEVDLDQMRKKDLLKIILEQQDVSHQLQQLTDKINNLEAKFTELQSINLIASNTSSLLVKKVKSLEKELLKSQQCSRRECLDASGIAETVNDEDVEQEVCTLLRDIGVEIDPNKDIQACHRYGRKNNVIVKFTNRKTVKKALENRKELPENVYISETLCPRNKSIRGRCAVLKKQGKIANVATRNGMVRIKHLNAENYVNIEHEDDLFDAFPDFTFDF